MAILGRIKKATSFLDFLNRFKKKTALKISDFLNIDNIIFLEAKNKNSAILELIDVLDKSKTLTQKDEFYKKIIEREKIISTGIGMGVAVPHAKLAGLDSFFLAIGIQKEYKIHWNSIDKMPIRLVFMIGGPEDKQNEYLQLLSKLTIALKNDHFRRNLLKATAKEEIIKLFKSF